MALLQREARRLHQAARSDSLAASLPVLRRLLASATVPRTTLPQAFRQRDKLQRKHLLRLLACEAGFESWEAYRPTLATMQAADLEPMLAVHRDCARLKHWFSDEAEARRFAARHGGRSVRLGRQAAVLGFDQAAIPDRAE